MTVAARAAALAGGCGWPGRYRGVGNDPPHRDRSDAVCLSAVQLLLPRLDGPGALAAVRPAGASPCTPQHVHTVAEQRHDVGGRVGNPPRQAGRDASRSAGYARAGNRISGYPACGVQGAALHSADRCVWLPVLHDHRVSRRPRRGRAAHDPRRLGPRRARPLFRAAAPRRHQRLLVLAFRRCRVARGVHLALPLPAAGRQRERAGGGPSRTRGSRGYAGGPLVWPVQGRRSRGACGSLASYALVAHGCYPDVGADDDAGGPWPQDARAGNGRGSPGGRRSSPAARPGGAGARRGTSTRVGTRPWSRPARDARASWRSRGCC